jgi:hypothetical protein
MAKVKESYAGQGGGVGGPMPTTRVSATKRLSIEALPTPPGWCSDSLSDFIEAAHQNRFATFVNKKSAYSRLSELDACFLRIAEGWINPQSVITPHLFLRSHAAYRAACEHALAGQVAELFPGVRACLEHAAYALHLHANPSLEEVWMRRHDDDATMKAVKREFHVSNVRASIERSNRHAAKVFDLLYQRAIDFGGHPNERAITGNLILEECDHGQEFRQIYLHGEGLTLDHGLKTTAQAGVCALEILQEVFKARFELLGVRAELLRLRRGL